MFVTLKLRHSSKYLITLCTKLKMRDLMPKVFSTSALLCSAEMSEVLCILNQTLIRTLRRL